MYIPSALSKRECALLAHYARRRYVTEVGSLLGRSTIAMAETATHVVAIDRHCGYDGWPNDTERQLRRNLCVSGVAKRVLVIKDDYTEMFRYPADFVFIDLDGSYLTTAYAMNLAQSPLVAVHDYQRTSCQGVGEAVEDCGYKVIERADSLIVMEKRPSLLYWGP